VYRSQLAKVYKGDKRGNGRDSVDTAFDELIAEGFIVYTPKDPKTGKFIHRYDVYPESQGTVSEIKEKKPKPVKPRMAKASGGLNTQQPRKDSSTRKEENLSVADAPVGSPPDESVSEKLNEESEAKEGSPSSPSEDSDIKSPSSPPPGAAAPPPTTIKIKTRQGDLNLRQDELYRRISNARVTWSVPEIDYAWAALAECDCVVHDWWGFIEGTIKNFKNKEKSKRATGQYTRSSRHKSQNRSKGCTKKTVEKSSNYKQSSSGHVFPGPASPGSETMAQLQRRLFGGSPTR
jgi:hypothetical protein